MKKVFFLLFFVLISTLSQAQWGQVNGPKDPFSVPDMIAKDTLLLVATSRGSFYSSDAGSTWNPMMPEVFTTSVLFHDTVYTGGEGYPGSSPSQIRKMNFDSGYWQITNVNDYGGLVNDMFADDDTVFVASASTGGDLSGNEAGFIFSADGTTWHKYNTGLPKDSVLTMTGYYYVYNLFAVSTNHQYIFTGTKNGIYRSPKSVLNWSAKNNGLPAEMVSAIFSNDTVLIVAIKNNLYKSVNQGESWVMNYTFAGGNEVNRIRLINDTLFALTQDQGLYLSADWGASWSPANNGLNNQQAYCIAKLGSTHFLGHGTGISKGLDTWVNTNNDMVCSNVRDMEQTDLAMAATESEQVFISPDEGLTWDQRTPFQLSGYMGSIVNVNGCLFFSFNPGYPADCINYLSCDNGNTWSQTAPLVNYGDSYALRSNGTRMVATVDNVIYISSDKGSTWTDISPPLGMIINDFSDVLFMGNELYISALYNTAEVIRSSDFGVTWHHCDEGLGANNIYKLGGTPEAVFALSSSGIFRSVDQGQTWQECVGLGDGITDFVFHDDLIFACKNTRVYFSRNMGASWTDISAGLPPLPDLWGGTLMVRDHFLYFGTFTFGIWKIDTQNLPYSVAELSAIHEFELYPNPAVNEINIVSRRGMHIKSTDILDLSGRVVQSGKITRNKIEIGLLSPNLYVLRIETTDGMRYHVKFVKL